MATVGIVGLGSIGSVLAKGFDELGHTVVGNDIDDDAVEDSPAEHWSKSWLAKYCDYVLFALPTPTTEQGGDASIVDEALEQFHDTDATLILRSTMPPGSTQRLAEEHDLPLVYTPEFLRDRSGVEDFFTPDRMVFAGPDPEVQAAKDLFADIDCDTVIETDYLSAELGKEAHNAFFATKVSFANQMRLIAEQVGADPQTVMDIITADSRNTDSHLDPLLGPYGGACLPKDTEALAGYAEQSGVDVTLLHGTMHINQIAKHQFENVEIDGNWPHVEARGD